MADRLVVVAAHLLGRSQTAPPHDEQQGARDLLGRGPQPVERRALCLAEPGATAQAAVALMSAHMAIAHDMRLLAVAIGARRTGSRWTHRVAPPTLPSSNSYASPVTTGIPRSRAIWATVFSLRSLRRTASTLNSRV